MLVFEIQLYTRNYSLRVKPTLLENIYTPEIDQNFFKKTVAYN